MFARDSRQQYRFVHKCISTLNTLSSITNQSAALPLAMRFYDKYLLLSLFKPKLTYLQLYIIIPNQISTYLKL